MAGPKAAIEKPQQLYQVDEDPTEEHNLFGEHPELEKQLTQLMEKIVTGRP